MWMHMQQQIKMIEEDQHWKKILYKQQKFPDNYVDDSFLEAMKRNVNTTTYSLQTLVYEAAMVSQQLSSIAIFGSVFCYMDSSLLSPFNVLLIGLTSTLAGYLLTSYTCGGKLSFKTKQDDFKSVILVLGVLLGLSPLLKTLTKTISTDTIYAMTICMLGTNLLFHDYFSDAVISSRSLSLNASVFASVCLASRLPSSWHAFVTVLIAMLIFALMPQIRATLKDHHKFSFVALTIIMACTAIIMVLLISLAFSLALVVCHFSIIIIFPCWMVKLQSQKNNIHGPWDEAMIHE